MNIQLLHEKIFKNVVIIKKRKSI